MATYATLTVDPDALLENREPGSDVVVKIATNTGGVIFDTATGKAILANWSEKIAGGAATTFSLPTTDGATNPTDFQYMIVLNYIDTTTRDRKDHWNSGWVSFTADATLAGLVAEQYVPPTWMTTNTATLQTYVDAGQAAATTAAAASTTASGAADTAVNAAGLASEIALGDAGAAFGAAQLDPASPLSVAQGDVLGDPTHPLTAGLATTIGDHPDVVDKVAKGELMVNVIDYDAVGDGVTVDTQAFRDAAAVAANGTVIVPAGTYLLDDSVSYPCTFLFMPGASVTNGGKITGSQVSLTPRDYDALMGCGYFNIWLDGNTFATPATNTHVATLWRVLYDGTSGTFGIDQAGGPLSIGAGNGLRWNQTVAGAGSTYRMIEFRIEDASIFNGDKATLSLIAQTEVDPAACSIEVVQAFGTGGSPSADVTVATENFTATATSQRFQFTFDVPVTSAKTFGSAMNDSLKVRIKVPNNSTFNVIFKQVRLERGAVRSNFSQIPLSMQHAYIARYIQYAVIALGSVATAASQYTYCPIPFNGEMRAAPTITWSTVSGATINNVSVGPAATHIQKYGASAYIASTAAGAFNAAGQQAKLDARL